ncbi:MAG: AAA family ATPase [Tepidisphaera sp.]|nr:AAA family ATPase [Tepidisphaera sp.]
MTQQLTAAQQQAVTHAAGPLIVLAGPGTGKTRVITHRIAHMLQTRGVSPERVLAVTFSVKAAQQLRDRLTELVGPLAASLNVHTFNGLGMRILKRHAGVLGLGPSQTLIDAAQASRLLQDVILRHGLFPDARGQGLASIVSDLLPRFESFATHGAGPEKCAALLAAWPAPSDADASDDAAVQRELRGRFEQEARAYEAYTAERLRRGWLTYNDQLLLPIRLLRERPNIAAMYRAEFAHVVVDEFQDCNQAQIELLSLFAGRKNHDICVVGDDDQSIYGFRGADDQAFTRFERLWPGTTVVALSENWRSAPVIINVSGRVIARAGRRFRPDKAITSPPARASLPGSVEAIGLKDHFSDADAIRDMLLTSKAKAAASNAPFAWNRFAVIANSHTDLARIAGSLTLAGVPVDLVREKTLLDDDGVKDVLAWANWIIDPGAMLHSRRLSVRPPVLAPLEIAAAIEARYRAARAEGHTTRHFADYLAHEGDVPDTLRRLARQRADLVKACAALTGEQAIDAIIAATDPAHSDMLPGIERARRVRALIAFVSLVRDKQPRLAPPGDLAALLDHLELLRSLGAMNLSMGLGDVDGEETDSAGADDGAGRVQLLTAHSSKGLEFDTVFVPRVAPSHGYPTIKSDSADPLPPGLSEQLDPRPAADRRLDEQRRVFYVACTRAERRLVLLAKSNKHPSKSTHFFEEILRDSPEVVKRAPDEIRQAALDAGLALPGRWPLDPAESEKPEELAARLRRAAREQAARALHAAEREAATPELLAHASTQLAAAARQLALLAEIERTGAAPHWMAPGADVQDLIRRMAARQGDGPPLTRPMPAPLKLSYSAINAYEKCPRCFYFKHVLGLPDSAHPGMTFGSIVHRVLEEFFDAWRLADAEGRPTPTLEDALALANAHEAAHRAGQTPPDPATLDQLLAQVTAAVARLHTPADHILELERAVRFAYVIDGQPHQFEAKIDRLDTLPDGRRRIVDYKTGGPTKSLLEPKKDDLQLGVYALALAHLDGTPDQTPPGVAEYWVLSTGQRGAIDLEALDLKKVRAKIDAAARGMLAGQFDPDEDCTGLCRVLG